MHLDFQHYLREDILVKTDRASMLNSLELRSPMLDQHVMEFAFNLDSKLKVSSNRKKIILNELARKILPDKFALNRKQGFSIPLNQWLQKGEWLEYFKSILLDTGSIYKESVVNRLIKANQKGYYNSERLFSLVIFELWRRKYNVSF